MFETQCYLCPNVCKYPDDFLEKVTALGGMVFPMCRECNTKIQAYISKIPLPMIPRDENGGS